MENTAVIVGWQSPRLQQTRSPNTAAVDTETKGEGKTKKQTKKYLPLEEFRYAGMSSKLLLLPLPTLK